MSISTYTIHWQLPIAIHATHHVHLRTWLPDDALALSKIANNPNIACNMRNGYPMPFSLVCAERFIAQHQIHLHGQCEWAICHQFVVVGSISLAQQSDVERYSAELGYWIGEPYWRRGYATLAIKALLKQVFTQTAIERIFAQVFEGNSVSAELLAQLGFHREARKKNAGFRDGKFFDIYEYVLLKQHWLR